MSSEIVLKVENVGKRYEIYEAPHHRLLQTLLRGRKQFYKEFWALKDVSFEVKKGECLGIIGRNGCGKSTLLQIIAGTLVPTTGRVSVNGKIAALLELGSGFNSEFTGRENVYMNGAIMGLSRAEMDKKFDEIAVFADIGEFIDQPVKIYSSGMFARLAFAVAINVDPDILIVDEILSVGDMAFQAKCAAKLRMLQNNKVTILFVSHSLPQVKQLCSKAVYLKSGTLCKHGDTAQVCDIYSNDNSFKLNDSIAVKSITSKSNAVEEICFKDLNLRKNSVERNTGTLDIEFTGIRLFDKNGLQTDLFTGLSYMKVVASMVVNKKVSSGAAVGLLISDKFGYALFHCNTDLFNHYLPELQFGEKINVTWEFTIPFSAGEFRIDIGVKPDQFSQTFFDRVFCARLFSVSLPAEFHTVYSVGLIYVPAKIDIKKAC